MKVMQSKSAILAALIVFVFLAGFSGTALAVGCDYTITFENSRATDSVILKEIWSRTSAGFYIKQWDGSTTIHSGDAYEFSIHTDYKCSVYKDFKVKYVVANSSTTAIKYAIGEQVFTWSL